MFGFRRSNEVATEIKRLRNLLERNPADSRSRLTLADFCLKAGDQETAIREYCVAAKQLSTEGLDLEPIAVYKEILSLDCIALTEKSVAAVREAEELLVKARKTYEMVFQEESQDDEAKEPSEAHHEATDERKADLGKEENPGTDDAEPVPLEIYPTPSQDKAGHEMPQDASPEEDFSDQKTSSGGSSPSGGSTESHWDGVDQEPLESEGRVLDGWEARDSLHEAETIPETDSFDPKENTQKDIKYIQVDDDLEVMLSDYEAETEGEDDEDLSATSSNFHEPDPLLKSSQFDTSEAILESSDHRDPDLPYDLGVAYYEMDLIEKAITEFVRAHNQGIKPVESLSMLAECYCKKGLFQNAKGFIGQALALDNLTQDQIDLLRGQLEEIKARIE